jgi:hypothetical protein
MAPGKSPWYSEGRAEAAIALSPPDGFFELGTSSMEPANDLMADFPSPCGAFKITVDDDGKVAYAYLKQGKTIVGDVWLYNRCTTPDQTEWKDRSKLPFANIKGYMHEEGRFSKPARLEDVKVEWQYLDGAPWAYIHLFDELVAVVGIGDKPGCSRFALKDGPLARVLVTA